MNTVITIDGLTSSGKSTTGLLLARRLGYQFVDSGLIYRAGCYALIRHNYPLDDEEVAAKMFKSLDLMFQNTETEQKIYIDREDITSFLRGPEITAIVPVIGSKRLVREVVKQKQRELGNRESTVMTGRDIGTEVFPEARIKYFITAFPEIRAYRRFRQLADEGLQIDYAEVLKQLLQRDYKDTTREVSPSRRPENAIVIDTNEQCLEDVVNRMYHEATKMLSEGASIYGDRRQLR